MAIQDTSKLVAMGAAIQDLGGVIVGGTSGNPTAAKPRVTGGSALRVGADGIPQFGKPLGVAQVANGNALLRVTASAVYSCFTCSSKHVASEDFTDLSLVYESAIDSGSGESAFSNIFEVKCSVVIGAENIPVFFQSGNRLQLFRPGARYVTSPLGVRIAKGTTFYVRTFVNRLSSAAYTTAGETGNLSANQTNLPRNFRSFGSLTGSGEEFYASVATGIDPFTYDRTDSGTLPSSSEFIYGYAPAAVLGTVEGTDARSCFIIGDSVGVGQGDGYSLVNSGRGWVARALGNNYGFVNGSVEGWGSLKWTPKLAQEKRFLAGRCSFCVNQSGVNDLFYNFTTAQQLFDQQVIVYNEVKNYIDKIFWTTLTPSSTSTDYWQTVANQTPDNTGGYIAKRAAYNALVRSSGYPYIDVAAACENSSGDCLWKLSEVFFSGTATANSTTAITMASATWTVNQWCGYTVVINSTYTTILSNTATVLTLSPALGGAPGNVAFSIIGAYSTDGDHMTGFGYQKIADSIPTNFFA